MVEANIMTKDAETKKIAVCFSGQLRTWKHCISTWQDFFKECREKYNIQVDVFCHFWDHNTLQHGVSMADNSGVLIDPIDQAIQVPKTEIDEYLNLLKPISYKISDIAVSKFTKQHTIEQTNAVAHRYGNSDNAWMSSQFYSIMYSAHLKRMHEVKQQFKYDGCIRMRNDLYFESLKNMISIPDMLDIDRNTIYSCHTSVDDLQWFGRRLGDIYWYSDSPTFDKMCNFYQWLPTLGSKSFDGQPGPEHLTYFYAKMFNISIVQETNSLPKVARDSFYTKRKQETGLGPLGDHEILC